MTTLTYCTYTVKVRDLATIATLGRKVRPRGGRRTTATDYRSPRDMWRDCIILRGCVAYAGDPDETFITYVTGEQRDIIPVAVPYDIIAAAVKGRRAESVIIHSDGRLECDDDTVYTWSVSQADVRLPIDPAEVELAHVACIMGGAFRHMVQVTTPSASADDSRPMLTGVCLTSHATNRHHVEAAATDSYRLTACECDAFDIAEDGMRTVIHARALKLAAGVKCYAYIIERNADHVRIAPSDASPLPHPLRIYTRRMMDDGYPQVQKLWPEGYTAHVDVDAVAFANAMRAAHAAAKDAPVALHVEPGATLRITLQNRNVTGEWFVPMMPSYCNVPEPFVIGVNAGFALDAAEAVTTVGVERLRISMISPLRPMLYSAEPAHPVTGPANNRRVLLMPMRVA